MEYMFRRDRLFEKLPLSSIAILPSGKQKYRNADTEYRFRQKSDFYYLSGFDEPESVLILIKDKTGKKEFIVFCRPNQPEEEVWTGPRLGIAGAVTKLECDHAYAIQDLDNQVVKLLENKEHIIYSFVEDSKWNKRVIDWVNRVKTKARVGIAAPKIWVDLSPLIHEARLIKSPSEIELMRKASEISARAHKQLMILCAPEKFEYELEAEFIQSCMKEGVSEMAYPTIVGGGANACILHYIKNNARLKSGDLVLVDAGCEFQYYASDITRTYPVNGKFSAEQKAIYELVLKAQMAAIEKVRPGLFWNELQDTLVLILVEGLVELELLKGDIKTIIEQKTYQRFYMHSSGHWLGLDVHDVGDYKVQEEWRKLEAGMVLTIEPGIYISPNQPDVDERWWGIGVRIEDDILVAEQGFEVLSKEVPKTVESIEKIMSVK